MRFASSISSASCANDAVDELFAGVASQLKPEQADLVLLFATPHFDDDLPGVVERFATNFPDAILLGCTAEGTIGRDQELERMPSMAMLAASMPDVNIRPFHLAQNQLESATTAMDWERLVAVSPESEPVFVALADPFRINVPGFADRINEAFPGAPLLGGVASAATLPGENRLILEKRIHLEGIVGVALSGRLDVSTIVSQGCEPIGHTFVVTKGDGNVIHELGGRPALEQLQLILAELSEKEEKLVAESLFLGRAVDEHRGEFGRGDFLIHNIMAVDRKSGAMGIMGRTRVGSTVQFHVRDADSADAELRALLTPHIGTDVRGAMLFGCNGRGTHMWPYAGHDIGVLRELIGEVPAAGFFCGGEFGPIGGKNFVHGFTASIGLFREPRTTDTPNVSNPDKTC